MLLNYRSETNSLQTDLQEMVCSICLYL